MKVIPLNRGYHAIVDAEDYPLVSQVSWYEHRGYAVRTEKQDGKKTMVYMHRLLLDPPSDMVTDHINGNGLDNRRCNLRICTRAENNRNMRRTKSRKRADTHSQYKGVYWVERSSKWVAQIRVNKQQLHLGYFECEHEAAQAYNQAAKEYFGEFACVNQINKGDTHWGITNMKKSLKPCSLMPSGSRLEEVTSRQTARFMNMNPLKHLP